MLCDDLEGWIGGGVGRREGRCIYIATDIYIYIYIYISDLLHCTAETRMALSSLIGKSYWKVYWSIVILQ